MIDGYVVLYRTRDGVETKTGLYSIAECERFTRSVAGILEYTISWNIAGELRAA